MQALAHPFVVSIAGVFMSSFWQGLVIACALSICLRFAPRVSAASRFAVWAAGLLAAASLSVLPLALNSFVADAPTAANILTAKANAPLLQLDLRWSAVILGLWAAASLVRAAGLAVHSLRLRKLWKSATPIAASDQLRGLLAGLGRGRVEICSTTSLERPSVIGFFSPRILIPTWLLEKLTAGELEQIVLHEAQHLRRRDDWTNLAQKILLVLFPLNPALWWMERNLCREREMACDEGVVRATRAPRAYAACLASLAERGLRHRTEALSLGAWQRRSELAHRVHGILLRRPTLRPVASATLLGAMGCGLIAGSIELARCPQLVAFVPAQRADIARLEPATAAAVLGDAVYTDRRGTLVPGFRAVTAKAVIPVERPVISPSSPAQPKGGISRHAISATVPKAAPGTGAAKVAKANRPYRLKSNEAQQQWIVFTSVDQAQTADNGQLTSDFDAGFSGDSAGSPHDSQVRRTMKITRLILRILPPGPLPGSLPSQPLYPGAFRSGWFVIQL